METRKRESWGSSIGFILAIAGSAVGLGNVWKFPYITGLNGGGAFVLVYLFCILLVGMPVMLCEIVIGRRTRKNPYGAFKALQLRRSRFADTIGGFLLAAALLLSCSGSFGFAVIAAIAAVMMLTLGFAAVGLFSLITAMLILSYYSVVGGWIVEYTVKAFTGELHFNSVEAAGNAFGSFIHSPGRVVLWHLVFFGASALMVWGGIRNGIERWSKILMPALFLLLVALVFRSLTLPGAENGVAFFLTPDFSKLSTAGALEALGHSFYTLSLGMGITITYGSYLSRDRNIFSASLWVIVLDTGVAILAGLTILLPFLGPVASFVLTFGVCIGFCESHLLVTLIGVSAAYVLINGILEQLILYPSFVGGAIGLSTIETISVVLIGGLVAGITGMILAVPAAAVIKYLIPKIYELRRKKEIASPEA